VTGVGIALVAMGAALLLIDLWFSRVVKRELKACQLTLERARRIGERGEVFQAAARTQAYEAAADLAQAELRRRGFGHTGREVGNAIRMLADPYRDLEGE